MRYAGPAVGAVTPKRILVVEDDAATSAALAECLRDEGYAVTCAGDGVDAIRMLRTMPHPDVILLDLMLPRMDGWDVRAAQKQDPALAGIPVIALSAVGWMVDADVSIRKPFGVDELLDAIKRLCGAPDAEPNGI